MIEIGNKAPDFTLEDQDSKQHSLSQYRGKFILVYFYPKDDTPGCTREACSIKDAYAEFKKAGITVLGISKDLIKSHKKFADKYKLPFMLLSDPKRGVMEVYGANRKPIGTRRISYLINKEGIIVKNYPDVSAENHADQILKDFVKLK